MKYPEVLEGIVFFFVDNYSYPKVKAGKGHVDIRDGCKNEHGSPEWDVESTGLTLGEFMKQQQDKLNLEKIISLQERLNNKVENEKDYAVTCFICANLTEVHTLTHNFDGVFSKIVVWDSATELNWEGRKIIITNLAVQQILTQMTDIFLRQQEKYKSMALLKAQLESKIEKMEERKRNEQKPIP